MKMQTAPSPGIKHRGTARGFILLDALVAVLIFSVGIVGMVTLQGSAVQLTSSANYRLNAALAADQVISQMWASGLTTLQTNFNGSKKSGGAGYLAWMNNIDCTSSTAMTGCLPGVPDNPPIIQVVPETITNSQNTEYQVTVTVSWQAPGDSNAHSYVTVTDIGT
jgi:type IV pilus assembly protein PilV